MNSAKKRIGCVADSPVDRDDLPVSPALKVERRNDPWYGYTEEEIEDCREFIRCYLRQEFEVLLQIPVGPRESDFWFESYEEFLESAFNTHDFQRNQKPFDKYGYRVKKVLEKVEDLAILHSCISSVVGRENVHRTYQSLVEVEFREPALRLVGLFRTCADPDKRLQLKKKIARYSMMILKCNEVWRALSPPE